MSHLINIYTVCSLVSGFSMIDLGLNIFLKFAVENLSSAFFKKWISCINELLSKLSMV